MLNLQQHPSSPKGQSVRVTDEHKWPGAKILGCSKHQSTQQGHAVPLL